MSIASPHFGTRAAATILALVAALSLMTLAARAQTPGNRPNIILISVDTLRADRLGAYGYKAAATPAIDSLAADSIVFERAIAQVPLTWPSHAAIFTGTYPFFNGVQDFTGQLLSPEIRTVTESLKGGGYATAAVVSAFVLDRSWGLDRGFDTYEDAFSGQAFVDRDLGLVDRRAEQSVDLALAWLDRNAENAKPSSAPFFLWLHLFDPHSPYDAPEPYGTRFRRRPYDGEIAYADHHLGRLFAWLKEKKLYDDALIVFLSDHGESLGDHGEDEHGFFVYNSTVHVPLIVKPPAGAGYEPRRVSPPVETIRVAPTLLRLAGVRDAIQGQFQAGSLLDLMRSGRERSPRPAYAETFYPFSSFGWSPLRSVQDERFHYIQAPQPELYDMATDPAEKKDLAPTSGADVAKMGSSLQRLVNRYQAGAPESVNSDLSPDAVETLRSLGYVASSAPNLANLDPENLADPKAKLQTFNNILRATDAMRAGRFATASALLRDAEKSEPDLYLIPFLNAGTAARRRDWLAAERHYRRTLELNPGFDEAMTGLARALLQNREVDEAEQWLRKAIDISPRNYRAWFQLSRLLARGNLAAARAALHKALSIQPNFAPAHLDLGMLEVQAQDFPQAVQHLEKSLELGLAGPELHNFLGIAYNRTDRVTEAVESYRRAIAARPGYADAHLNLALALQRLNRQEESRKEYETACKLKREFCRFIPGRGN